MSDLTPKAMRDPFDRVDKRNRLIGGIVVVVLTLLAATCSLFRDLDKQGDERDSREREIIERNAE